MNKPLIGLGAALTGLALTAAACGSNGAATSRPGTATPAAHTSATPTTAEPAVALRGQLDALLRQHVNLTANAVQVAVESGLTSGQTSAALDTLDGNTQALGAAVGSLYGAPAQSQFLDIWRQHIGFFVDFTKAVATGDTSARQHADANLRGTYEDRFSTFLSGATKNALPVGAVRQELTGHIDSLESALTAIVQKSPTAAADVLAAAMHMDGTAKALAGGLAATFPSKLTGNTASPAADLLASLTGELQSHVAQTGVVVTDAVTFGLSSTQVGAATQALDMNTQSLGSAIGTVYGSAAQSQFLDIWRQHIGFFVDFAKAAATGDTSARQQADANLRGTYEDRFSDFLAQGTGGRLGRDAVKQVLTGHIDTLEAAITAIVAKSSDASRRLADAEGHMTMTARAVAGAVATQFPARFSG